MEVGTRLGIRDLLWRWEVGRSRHIDAVGRSRLRDAVGRSRPEAELGRSIEFATWRLGRTRPKNYKTLRHKLYSRDLKKSCDLKSGIARELLEQISFAT